MGTSSNARKPSVALLLVFLFLASCSEDVGRNPQDGGGPRETTVRPVTLPEATAEEPPKITLQEEPGGRPEVVLRLEGSPKTTFSGLCSVGEGQNVLGGRVPKRFTFDLEGRELSCRIQKRDGGRGALKVVLEAGNTTRSVQQTNAPESTINVRYRGE